MGSSRKVVYMTEDVLKELVKITTDALSQVDAVNKKLVNLVVILAIISGLTIVGVIAVCCGFYFLSDYQYPDMTQTSLQSTGSTQEVSQKITQEISQKGGVK